MVPRKAVGLPGASVISLHPTKLCVLKPPRPFNKHREKCDMVGITGYAQNPKPVCCVKPLTPQACAIGTAAGASGGC